MGITRIDKREIESIGLTLNTRSIITKIEEKKLKWTGHIVRMKEDRKVKNVCEARKTGKNKKGRPRTTWNNSVAEMLKKKVLIWMKARKLAHGRKKWRQLTEHET